MFLDLNKYGHSHQMQQFMWNCPDHSVSTKTVFDLCGRRIGEFCKEYTSFLVNRLELDRQKRGVRKDRGKCKLRYPFAYALHFFPTFVSYLKQRWFLIQILNTTFLL